MHIVSRAGQVYQVSPHNWIEFLRAFSEDREPALADYGNLIATARDISHLRPLDARIEMERLERAKQAAVAVTSETSGVFEAEVMGILWGLGLTTRAHA